MTEVLIKAKVYGQDRDIIINNDPSWGTTKQLMQAAVITDARGVQRTDMNSFFDKLLQVIIVSGFDEVKDNLKREQVPISEMSYILGEILKAIPLQKYFGNLGMSAEQLLPTT